MNSIAANELKTQGVSLLESRLAVDDGDCVRAGQKQISSYPRHLNR
jgi:hypothetical protein